MSEYPLSCAGETPQFRLTKPIFSFYQYFASLMEKAKDALTQPTCTKRPNKKVLILLADDDEDDRQLFKEVITEINAGIQVQVVEDGSQLMKILNEVDYLPDMLFLDLNMPCKDGKECLREIKDNERLKDLPVVIYSTSAHTKDIHDTHVIGANLYIRKPNTFSGQISVIKKVFSFDLENLLLHPPLHKFVLIPDAL